MPDDPNGVHSLPAGYRAVDGETILSSNHNPPLEDISVGLTARLPRNGSAPMLANLAMGANKITNLAPGTNATDAVNKSQLDAFISPDGSITTAKVADNAITNAKRANMAQATISGRAAGAGTGAPTDLPGSEVATIIGPFSSGAAGLAPASGGGTTNFLRADGTWTSPPAVGNIILVASQATTSGTQFDFTGLPAGINEIVVHFMGVSLTTTDDFLVQLGTSGGVENTGYTSTSLGIDVVALGNWQATSTSGFVIVTPNLVQPASGNGNLFLRRASGNTWTASVGMMMLAAGNSASMHGGGVKTLAGTLDRVRLTRTGTDTFDAGAVSISYQ
jgi:hypothetical protein